MKQTSRYIITRRLLIFWTLFIGLGAVAGSVGMLVDPTGRAMGMDAMLPYFEKLPFSATDMNVVSCGLYIGSTPFGSA